MKRLVQGIVLLMLLQLTAMSGSGQEQRPGIIAGNLIDEKSKAVASATVELVAYNDSIAPVSMTTDKDGAFVFNNLRFSLYRLKISYIGYKQLVLDSINVRAERSDFNLNDITLKQTSASDLNEVVVYAEKPLIESKDGNIIFNAAESALSAGSNANELLKSVPLVAVDPNGKVTLRGREPKILIDDKPVELNLQQLQDLLESLPGSSIEKIEVMTNPPPQYANEPGGVINIVTRKGKPGLSGRINLTAGSRNDVTLSSSVTYRRNGLAVNFNAGVGSSRYNSEGYSKRQNIYADSTNYFNSTSSSVNRATRPNGRLSVDYDFDKRNAVNVTAQFNQNDFSNHSQVEYMNMNQFHSIYRLSHRDIASTGGSNNPFGNASYIHKGKVYGEILRIVVGYNYSYTNNERNFYQQFLNPDYTPNGIDSTQRQQNNTWNSGYSARVSYDKPMNNFKTFISVGSYYTRNNSRPVVSAYNFNKAVNAFVLNDLLSNDFRFHQSITNYRASVKQVIVEGLSVLAGTSVERTDFSFDFTKATNASNSYLSWLPFGNITRNWNDRTMNLTLAYRRSIRRPGIGELNPTVDISDPYTIRFGNPNLQPSLAHNFDLMIGKTTHEYYLNLGVGYNIVSAIYQSIRTLLPDGRTQITWDNISSRHEYEISTWNGYTFSKKLRLNASATYSYNQYSEYDKTVNRYRDGGTFTSNLSTTWMPTEMWNATGQFTYNRFSNPQGSVRGNLSMNLGIQRKLFNKKLIITVNAIDPFFQ
ncbi:MAG: outer membrane beta-barrel protein, partial [Bacteroidetes bacterium]|nr:outer membrane beta-barrel protein [Bacteroidota bacterium]